MDLHYAAGGSSAEGTGGASGGKNIAGRQHLQHQQQIRLPISNVPPHTPQQAPHGQLHQHQLNEAAVHPRGETSVGGAEASGRNNTGRQNLQHQNMCLPNNLPLQLSHQRSEATSVRSWGGNPIPAAMQPGAMEPGTMRPGANQPGAMQPGAMQPDDPVVGGNVGMPTIQDFIHRCEILAQRAANSANQLQASWNMTGSRSNDQQQQQQDYAMQLERALQTAAHYNAISNLALTWANEVPATQKKHLDLLRRISAAEAETNPQNYYMGAHATTDQDRRQYVQQHDFMRSLQVPNMGARVAGGESSRISAAHDHHQQQQMGQHHGHTRNPSQAQNTNTGVAASNMSHLDKMDFEPIRIQSLRQDTRPLHPSQLDSAAPLIYAASLLQQQGVAHSAVQSRLGNHQEAPADSCIQSLAGEDTRNSQIARADSMRSDSSSLTSISAANSSRKSDRKSAAAIPSRSESQYVRPDQKSPGSVAKMPTDKNALQGQKPAALPQAGKKKKGPLQGQKPAALPQADCNSEGAISSRKPEKGPLQDQKPATLPQADCNSEGDISGRKLEKGQPSTGKAEVDVGVGDRVRLGPLKPEAKRPPHSARTQSDCNPQKPAASGNSASKPSQQPQSSTERTAIAGLKPAGEFGPELLHKSDASVDANRFKQKESNTEDDVRDALNGITALPRLSKRKKSTDNTSQSIAVRRSTRKRVSPDNEPNKCGDVSKSNMTEVVPKQASSKKKPNASARKMTKRKREDISNEARASAIDSADQTLPLADESKWDAMDVLSRASVNDAAVKRPGEEPNVDKVEGLSGKEFSPSKLCKVVETSTLGLSSYIYAPMGHLWLDQELTGSSEMNVDTFCPAGTMVGRRWVWDEGHFVDEHCNPHSREHSTLGSAGAGTSTNSCADPVPPSRARRAGRNRLKSSVIEQLAAGGLDPHTQITCEDYEHGPSSRFRKDLEADTVQPFAVRVSPDVPFIVDLHAHLCTSEIIGLLGGV